MTHYGNRALSPFRRDDAPKLTSVCPRGKQGPHEQVHANRGVSRFHLGDPGLTRTDPTGEFGLRPIVLFPQLSQSSGERQFDLDELCFARRQFEEIPRIADAPSCVLQLTTFVSFHNESSRVASW
jgi:hypothetical protein